MNFELKPRGYGKCYHEYKNVVEYFENEIEDLKKDLLHKMKIINQLGDKIARKNKQINDMEMKINNLQTRIDKADKIIERLVNYNELVCKRYYRKIKDHTIRSITKHNLEIIKELKEEGK